MVDAEFSTELKEDRIAPNITAAKKPRIGFGITCATPASGKQGRRNPSRCRVSQCADNAWNNDDQRSHDLEEACKYGALLCFLQVLSTEGTLDDGLVGCPVVHVVDQQAGE